METGDEKRGKRPSKSSAKGGAKTGAKKRKPRPLPSDPPPPAELPEAPSEEPEAKPPAPRPLAEADEEEIPLRVLLARAFLHIDTRVLALFRMMLSFALLQELVRRAAHTTMLFSNKGVLPNHFVQYAPQAQPQFSAYLPFSEPDEVRFAFALTGIVFVLLGVGYQTRIVSVLAFVAAFSMNTRNLFIEDGGCAALTIMACWGMFFPLGARFSVDAVRRGMRHELEGRPLDRAAITAPHVSLAVLGVVLQFALVYFFNALHKKGLTWRQGTAVHYVLWQNRLNTPFAVWLRPLEPGFLSPLLSYGTLLLEACLPALALSPYHRVRVRTFAVLAAISFHLGIVLTMTLGPFSYAMIALDILLLPGEALDWAKDRWLHVRNDVVLRVRGDELGPRWVAALYRALSGGRFVIEVDRDLDERLQADIGGARVREDDLTLALRAALPLPTQLVARVVAEPLARAQLAWTAPWVDLPRTWEISLRRPREAFIAVFIFAMLLQMSIDNPAVPKWLRIAPPGPLKAMNDYPRLIQAWNMFSPDAPTDDGVLVVDAVTATGRHVDPFTGEAPDFERIHQRAVAHTAAVGDYVSNVRTDNNKRFRRDFERYVFDYPEGSIPEENKDRVVSFEAYWVSHDSPKPGSLEPTNLRKELSFSGKR